MTDAIEDCFLAALKAIESEPRQLLRRAKMEAEDRGVEVEIDDLHNLLISADHGEELRTRLHLRLGVWDGLESDAWTAGTTARTAGRRQLIYEKCGLVSLTDVLDASMPVHGSTTVVVDAGSVKPWYPPENLSKRDFYWPHYRDLLQSRGWSAEALTSLDEATTRVVERIAPPAEATQYSARGLVVGHVQSGKTANFTGSIAKAIDAGYRLVIVLTGTIEILRQQTQRRLDQELVGVENITNGLEPDDPSLNGQVEYLDDPAWQEGNWLRHGVRPSLHNFPDIIRLTTRDDDYRGLAQGINTLELKKADKSRPLYDPTNLYASNALIAVVKKQTHRLDALLKDLNLVSNQLREIPALILDDESDQASINTSDPKKWKQGQSERTSINQRISDLLQILPRGQYIGYTATPFANVFIDPGDGEDLFPRDFLLSLTPPDGYMGIAAFHDEDQSLPVNERPYATSSQRSHVRDLTGVTEDDRDQELAGALDAFVLTGAVKLYRESQLQRPDKFRHHTMLVHESVRQKEHSELAKRIQELWDKAGFTSGAGLRRLRSLWEEDFRPVSLARSEGFPVPSSFDDLKAHVAQTVARVCEAGRPPYIIVNGDQDIEREEIAFNQRSVWRVLVGGTSLSRGFTVEDLTISYYRRRTSAGDTTMQMGRWFGYRPGYRDLVRLFIGRNEPAPQGSTIDLYETFAGLMRDEDDFRKELARYAQKVEGSNEYKLTPRDIPPLVSQHLPQLPPTSRNKMYNAELEIRRFPGGSGEPQAWPLNVKDIEHNYRTLTPLIQSAVNLFNGPDLEAHQQQYLHSVIPHSSMVEALRGVRWLYEGYWRPELAYFEEMLKASQLHEWLLLLPQSDKKEQAADLPDIGVRSVYKRARRGVERKGVFGFISTLPNRTYAEELLKSYADTHPGRGVVLFYPIHSEDALMKTGDGLRRHITFAPRFLVPAGAMPPSGALVRFRVKDPSRASRPIIEAPS
ncbi:Z1 domain-containing protein [Kineococcus sp. R86509]|uniref:Z1 domain-containing protein n=1 Tax=Kineococcus sp. R86509 TaxID=3093851 RepID=UPI0036D3DFC5